MTKLLVVIHGSDSVMEKVVIETSNVKKLLSKLNENKSFGPDNLHPK